MMYTIIYCLYKNSIPIYIGKSNNPTHRKYQHKKTFGNVTQTTQILGIARSTYYLWLEKDSEFKKQIQEINPEERFLDFVESKLVEKIQEGDGQSIRWTLDRKGKSRGYVQRQEITGVEGMPSAFQIEIVKSKDEDTD